MMKKHLSYVMIALIISSLFIISVDASSYKGYIYNSWNEAVPSQIGYEPTATYLGTDFGNEVNAFNGPKDLFVTDNNDIYILDSGNNRLVVINNKFKLVKILKQFNDNGNVLTLNDPTGIFVDKKGEIYISDPNNQRVMVCDIDGNVRKLIGKPKTDMLANALEFKPQKVLVDSMGDIYITAVGVYQGALLFKPTGEFAGFVGSNSVEISGSLLLDKMWKGLLTDAQVNNIGKYIPEEFTSFDVDDNDFVYTVTQTSDVAKKIKKLNPSGNNILTANKFGELEGIYIGGSLTSSRFVDISVDKDGNMDVLDQQSNRVFQYDKEGQLLFVFGGSGFQSGTFQNPVAVSKFEDKIIVLDSKKSNITVFAKTEFGKLVHSAINYYNDGQYTQSADLWQSILKQDNNYEIAYVSVGKALLANKSYEAAAKYFVLGNDKKGNSDAFEAYRNEIIQKYFSIICLLLVVFIVLFLRKYNSKTNKVSTKIRSKMNPLKILFHPMDISEEMKLKNSGSILYAIIILGLWFVATVFEYSLTGFRFNSNNPDKMNILLLFLRTIPLFLIWVVSNWGFCTLTNGKGKMKDIFITNTYCLIPFVSATFIYVIFSQFFVLSEGVFLQWIMMIGMGWSILLLLSVLSAIHEYSFGQTMISVVISIIGVLIVIFLILLVSSLVQQAYSFVYSLANELFYRYS